LERLTIRYRADPPAMLLTEPLDALVAIFHRPSGTTHLLAPPAPEILDLLGREAMSLDALLARLAEEYALADADPAVLAERVAELVEAGLVHPA
jgi:PqqD family protein of HPr-rel-A system